MAAPTSTAVTAAELFAFRRAEGQKIFLSRERDSKGQLTAGAMEMLKPALLDALSQSGLEDEEAGDESVTWEGLCFLCDHALGGKCTDDCNLYDGPWTLEQMVSRGICRQPRCMYENEEEADEAEEALADQFEKDDAEDTLSRQQHAKRQRDHDAPKSRKQSFDAGYSDIDDDDDDDADREVAAATESRSKRSRSRSPLPRALSSQPITKLLMPQRSQLHAPTSRPVIRMPSPKRARSPRGMSPRVRR